MSMSNRPVRVRPADIAPGDVVRTSVDQSMSFRVLAVKGDKAWVRSLASGSDHLALVDRCRKISGGVAIA